MSAALKLASRENNVVTLAARAAALDRAAQGQSEVDIVKSALEEFADAIALVSSFGSESAALLHLVASVDKSTPVIFIDTAKHFVQTHSYRDQLVAELGLKDVRIINPDPADTAALDPKGDLWKRDNDACCEIRKIRPLASALGEFDAWFTGRKRVHGNLRAHLPLVEAAPPHIKVNPLARWSAEDIADYSRRQGLAPHPLVESGFTSIGCWPCTAPTAPGDDPRAGRWRGLPKTECGIHRI